MVGAPRGRGLASAGFPAASAKPEGAACDAGAGGEDTRVWARRRREEWRGKIWGTDWGLGIPQAA